MRKNSRMSVIYFDFDKSYVKKLILWGQALNEPAATSRYTRPVGIAASSNIISAIGKADGPIARPESMYLNFEREGMEKAVPNRPAAGT